MQKGCINNPKVFSYKLRSICIFNWLWKSHPNGMRFSKRKFENRDINIISIRYWDQTAKIKTENEQTNEIKKDRIGYLVCYAEVLFIYAP